MRYPVDKNHPDPYARILAEFDRAFTTKEAADINVMPWHLARLATRNQIFRIAHGIYLPKHLTPDHRSFTAEVGLRFPKAVICLRSAAELHDLTVEFRSEAFLARGQTRIPPSSLGNEVDGLKRIRWMRWTPMALEKGVTEVEVHGIKALVTSPARTVVDYLRYRKRDLFTEEEVMGVLDRYISRRSVRVEDRELSELAATFGVSDALNLILAGRREMVRGRSEAFIKAGF